MSETARFVAELKNLVAGFDPALLTGDVAAAEVGHFAEIERLAGCGKILAAGRVEETRMWQGQGQKSAADWLAEKSGSSVGEAAGDLRTAKKIKRLRRTLDEMKKGKLSTAQAGAVADGASADPNAEDDLLDTAEKDSLQNLKSASQKAKAAAGDDNRRHQRIHARRSVRSRIDDEGAFHLHLTGTATAGARITALLRPYQEHNFRQHRSDGIRDSFDARTYDAFMAMLGLDPHGQLLPTDAPEIGPDAEPPSKSTGPDTGPRHATPPAGPPPDHAHQPPGTACEHDRPKTDAPAPTGTAPPDLFSASSPDKRPTSSPHAGHPPDHPSPPDADHPPGTSPPRRSGSPPGPPPTAPPPATQRRPPVGGNNIKVIVRIDHSALTRGHTTPGETCEISGLGHIPVASVRALMHDAFLAAVITKGHDVHTVAHLGRAPNAFQRTALEATHIACSATGCNRTTGIEIDHTEPWADTHQTPTNGLDPLCTYHHQLKTHHGWTLQPGTGPRPMHPPAA